MPVVQGTAGVSAPSTGASGPTAPRRYGTMVPMTDESDTVGVSTRTVGAEGTTGDTTGSGALGSGSGIGDAVDEPVKIGDVVGSYRVVELLGTGGMGRVYRAEHVKLGRAVALKALNSKYSTNREAVSRLFGEARAVNQIHHQNLIEITDFLEPPEGVACYVMELLQGETVRAVVKRGPVAPDRVADIGAQVASALAAVHATGIIHRDLKPENIFLTTRGDTNDFVKLLDFGVAKLSPEVAGDRSRPVDDSAMLGTPLYMAPEQLSKGTASAASDVYSLGVTLYEMVTGARPFSASNWGDIVIKHVLEDPPPLARAGVPATPPELERLILACLSKAPEARPTAAALGDALRALASHLRSTATPTAVPLSRARPALSLLGAAVVVVGALVAVVVWRQGVRAPPPLVPQSDITLRFESTPMGATVTRQGAAAPLGVTPLSITLAPSSDEGVFVFALEGRPTVVSRTSLTGSATLSVIIPEPPAPPAPPPLPIDGKPEPRPGSKLDPKATPKGEPKPGTKPGTKPGSDDTVILDPFAG